MITRRAATKAFEQSYQMALIGCGPNPGVMEKYWPEHDWCATAGWHAGKAELTRRARALQVEQMRLNPEATP